MHGESEAEKNLAKNNMARNKIYEKDPLYSLLRPWTDWGIRYSYRKVEIHGEENLPKDGSMILAPNHCNTLMDALVILRAYKGSTVFGARADLFNSPFIAKIMFFLRILPMVRQRDGLRNVLKNVETQETIVETLENDVRFCMYPEGTHRAKHSLRPLGKGVSRAALAANEKFGNEKPVYIVPVGIEYGDYFRYHSTSLVNYGEPINVTEYVKQTEFENEAQIIDALRKELAERMSKLITYIPFDEDYEAVWALTRMLSISSEGRSYGQTGTSLHECMTKNQTIIEDIRKAREEHPEEMEKILKDAAEFERKRVKKGISIYSFKHRKNPVLSAIGKGFAALIGLPYFIFSAVANLPLWATSVGVRSIVKDPAFRNTASFGIKLGLTPFLLIIYTVLAFCLAPWWLALGLLVLWVPSYGYFYDYIEGCRRWISDIKLLGKKKLFKMCRKTVKEFKELNR